MEEEEMKAYFKANECIDKAKALCQSGYYDKAYNLYLTAHSLCQHVLEMNELNFRLVLIKLSKQVLNSGDIVSLHRNFQHAINALPSNVFLLNDIGHFFYKYHYYKEAWYYFQEATSTDPGYVEAEKNLNYLKCFLVKRWHFRMLNDKIRNEAYRSAIKKIIVPNKDTVLDVGTGTGLLSLYANESSPQAIAACDYCSVMAQLADVVLEENKIQAVKVINKMSTDIGKEELGCKISVLITETFDAGLFGEHILQTLSHAWKHLLLEGGQVIPNKAHFYVIGAKSDHLNKKYQLCSFIKTFLNIPTMNVHVSTKCETYDCDDVHLYKDLQYMTEPHCLLGVNFNSYDDIQKKLNSNEPYKVDLTATESGEINIIIGYFDLVLADNLITTNPRSKERANAWQQAVFYDNTPQTVTSCDSVHLEFFINKGELKMAPNHSNEITKISPAMLRFLNDTDYINMIKSCISTAYVYLGQIVDIYHMSILDYSPFPLFGLLMMKHGARKLVCHAENKYDEQFIKTVFEANKISLDNIVIVNDCDDVIRDYADVNDKFHAIFVNILDLNGDVNVNLKETSLHLKEYLIQGGLLMPANITLMGQIISCDWVDVNNRLYDSNVSNYKIAMHLNKYQVSQNYSIDLTLLEYKALTQPATLADIFNMESSVIDMPVIEDGDANAVICWYVIELMEDLGKITTFRRNAFIDGTLFLADPKVPMAQKGIANILCCHDNSGSFKLLIDVEDHTNMT